VGKVTTKAAPKRRESGAGAGGAKAAAQPAAESGEVSAAMRADRAEALRVLAGNGVPEDLASLYADAWAEFVEAVANVERNGAVCAHPRTGAPIENPYLRVRDRAFERLLKLRRKVDARGLWK